MNGGAQAPRGVSAATAPHYSWGDGCDGWRLADRPDLAVIEEQMPPGAQEQWHVHERARQFFYVLSGQAEMRTATGTVALPPGAGVEVPPGLAHQFAVTGSGPVRFLVVSAPSTRDDRSPAP